MAQSGSPLTWVLLAGAAYVAWEYFFSTPSAAAPAGGSTGGTTTPSCLAPNTLVNGVCTAPAPASPASTTITFSGPTADPATTAWLTGIAAAAGEGSAPLLNADQWSYYFNQGVAGSVPTTVDLAHPAVVDTNLVLSAGNISAANRSNTVMTAGQYLALVNQSGATGLSGYRGGLRAIPVPAMRARGFGQFTLGDLRRAGGR
jgi:hypothetical protein